MLNTTKKAFSVALLLVAFANNARADIFTHMLEEMNNMHKRTKKFFKQLSQELTSTQPLLIDLKEDNEKGVTSVIIKNLDIKDKSPHRVWDEDKQRWTITTPAGTILVHGKGKILSVETYYQENNEEENGSTKFSSSLGERNFVTLSLLTNLKLSEAQFEYSEKDKQLVIALPVIKKNPVTVPVVFKQAEEAVSEK